MATPYFNWETESVYLIPVEQLVRSADNFTGLANAYCLVLFACCREVKQITIVNTFKIINETLIVKEQTQGEENGFLDNQE